MPEKFTEFLRQVGDQIRWKRAIPVLTEELKTHLMEQKDACMAEGMDEDAAEAEALRQMGDALEIGRELDSVHRPKPQWGLLALVAALALAGGVLRAATGWYNPSKVCLFLCVGFACLAAGYFLDYSFFGRHAKAICLAALAASLLTLDVLPLIRYAVYIHGVNYYAYYLTVLFPFLYALGVYALRDRRWAGFAAALVLAGLFPVAGAMTGRLSGFVITGVCAMATLCYAVKRGWFGATRKAQYAVLALCAVLPCVFVWLRYGRSAATRLAVILHPEKEAAGRGFLPIRVRETLRTAVLWGEGAELPYDIREWSPNYILTTVARQWGWIPFGVLCAALATLFVLTLFKCLRMRNELGGILALAVSLPIGIRIAFFIAYNLGYAFLQTECPLLSGNLHTVIDMGLIGVMLSVFRQERLPEALSTMKRTQEPPRRHGFRSAAQGGIGLLFPLF